MKGRRRGEKEREIDLLRAMDKNAYCMKTLDDCINGTEAFMTVQAKAIAKAATDGGLVPHYSAKKHSGAAGKYIAQCVAEGLKMDSMAATLLFHSLANHSAWRQKFTKAKIFPEAVKAAAVEGEGKVKMTAAQKARAKFMEECGLTEEETNTEADGDGDEGEEEAQG